MSHYRRSHQHGATFFFTVTLADRRSTLLRDRIDLLRAVYRRVHAAHPFETIAICVLPDHLHAVWQLPEGDADFSLRWRLIKQGFSRGLPAAPNRSESKLRKREKGIWQRRFWEHQIRDDLDMERHVDYVHFNPVKHGWVSAVCEWQHSSFHRYVKAGILTEDWGGSNLDDAIGQGER